VEVELTADYGGNPMFADEAEARTVLSKLLRVHAGSVNRELTALAPLRFEERKHFDPTAPIPFDPITGAEPHQLLCALWSWKCATGKVAFEMPKDAGQSMILWTPATAPGKPPRWVFLLPGEVSPEIPIPHWVAPVWLRAAVSAGGLGVLIFLVRLLFQRNSAALGAA
jgi:hypothetical protein